VVHQVIDQFPDIAEGAFVTLAKVLQQGLARGADATGLFQRVD
jgi:hypothetical protein